MENKYFDFHEIKTFEDACKRLGLPEESLIVQSYGVASAYDAANAFYKLLVIQKVINNGVSIHEDSRFLYTPFFHLSPKKQ